MTGIDFKTTKFFLDSAKGINLHDEKLTEDLFKKYMSTQIIEKLRKFKVDHVFLRKILIEKINQSTIDQNGWNYIVFSDLLKTKWS